MAPLSCEDPGRMMAFQTVIQAAVEASGAASGSSDTRLANVCFSLNTSSSLPSATGLVMSNRVGCLHKFKPCAPPEGTASHATTGKLLSSRLTTRASAHGKQGACVR